MPGKRYDRQFKLSAARLVFEGEIPVKGCEILKLKKENEGLRKEVAILNKGM